MANTKRTNTTANKTTTTKKTATKPAKAQAETVEEVIEVEKEPVEVEPEKRVFHSDDMILCRSIIAGKLVLLGAATNIVYRWMNYGDECEVEYRDLVSAVRTHHPDVYSPYFIIEDDDFINENPELKKFYTEKFTLRELTDILYMNEDDMERAITSLPKGAKEQLINIAATGVSDGTLDSMKKIKTLERLLDVSFDMVAQMQ